ncbi:nuclease domain-containing protein, partial [Vibrio parahaemolyticus]|uniref:nuclease domain-containing protein n=2 Tax=Vibrio TaxID=662 RepID=UPI001C5EC1A6
SIRKNSTPLAKTNVIVEVGFDTFSLHFQKSYDEYWKASDDIGSYSRTMIPDISLRCSDSNKSIVVLDAKYRVEKALNDAIASSHMYRDAIVSDNGGS